MKTALKSIAPYLQGIFFAAGVISAFLALPHFMESGVEKSKSAEIQGMNTEGAEIENAATNDSKIGNVWLLGTISVCGFIGGAVCMSVGQSVPLEQAKEELPTDDSLSRAADSENLSSGDAIASPETEEIDRGMEGNPIDAKTPIFLWLEDQQKGPWVISQIRKMWESGSLTADVNYWTEGMENWSPLVALMEETAVAAPAAPVPPVESRPKVFKVTYDGKSQTFGGTMPLMVKLAMRAAQDM